MDDAALDALRTAASAVIDIGFAGIVGALVTDWMPGDATSAWAARRARVTRRAMAVAAGVAFAGALAWMAIEAISMTGLAPWAAIGESVPIVTGTRAGQVWAIEVGLIAVCGAAGASGRGERPVFATLAVLALAFARAGAGHAGAGGIDGQTAVMTMHLLAIGAWAGAVMVGAVVVMNRWIDGLVSSNDRQAAARYLAHLSALSTAALALVVATGVASGWHALGGHVQALAPSASTSTWAWTLDVKGALVAAAVALGAFNRFAALPPLRAALATPGAEVATARRRFARVLRIEALVMLTVLTAAAVLANVAPPTP